jgi:hypothetical protein
MPPKVTNPNKLYTVFFSTPYSDNNELVVESISLTDAKEFLQRVLTTNQYIKVTLANGKDMIVSSDTIKIKKASLYKQA